ncbi:MAG: NYN domain-containing protein [Chloroflexota bacterium]|nr:NYN domain-containing protein [Chloroflexota bacterium]
MSHNVGVFVDVSNLFYSAKSSNVEVNYCRLLEHAVAGRDLIRASAYTGVDPENPNQRKFIDFLRSNGYKVICKDIHKYEGGRIKANLDIEIAVDIMLLSANLDVVVLVSGDGDFVRLVDAIQSKGVRCEVVGFGISTSNELIEIADQFTEIGSLPGIFRNAPSGPGVPVRGVQQPQVHERLYASISAYSYSASFSLPGERLSGEKERERLRGSEEPVQGVTTYWEGRDNRQVKHMETPESSALPAAESGQQSMGYSYATHDEFMLPEGEACIDPHSVPLTRLNSGQANGRNE